MKLWHAMARDPQHCTLTLSLFAYACNGKSRVPPRAKTVTKRTCRTKSWCNSMIVSYIYFR